MRLNGRCWSARDRKSSPATAVSSWQQQPLSNSKSLSALEAQHIKRVLDEPASEVKCSILLAPMGKVSRPTVQGFLPQFFECRPGTLFLEVAHLTHPLVKTPNHLRLHAF